jgi:hypothetical protein
VFIDKSSGHTRDIYVRFVWHANCKDTKKPYLWYTIKTLETNTEHATLTSIFCDLDKMRCDGARECTPNNSGKGSDQRVNLNGNYRHHHSVLGEASGLVYVLEERTSPCSYACAHLAARMVTPC